MRMTLKEAVDIVDACNGNRVELVKAVREASNHSGESTGELQTALTNKTSALTQARNSVDDLLEKLKLEKREHGKTHARCEAYRDALDIISRAGHV